MLHIVRIIFFGEHSATLNMGDQCHYINKLFFTINVVPTKKMYFNTPTPNKHTHTHKDNKPKKTKKPAIEK